MEAITKIIQVKFMDKSNQEIFWGIFWIFIFGAILYVVFKNIRKP